ncbi:transmembrane protein 199-like [Oscarella lobularis]|uniref:transmembrane protein 199-like n=1 Tax=Oscarella lobularis TaxID=121494 RepID=UPI003313FF55
MQDPIVILGKDLEEIVRADEANTRVRQRDNGHLAMHCSDLKDFLSKHRQRVSVHEVLQDCDVCFEPVLAPPKNPELEARLAKLRAQEEQRKYDQMVRNVVSDKKGKDNPAAEFRQEVKKMRLHCAGMINYLITIVGAFFFGYFSARYAFSSFEEQILTGVVFGVVVLFVDLYFIANRSN